MGETFEDYLNRMINDGYLNKNLSPKKCTECENEDLESYDYVYEHMGVVEYKVRCTDCKTNVGYWTYGHWDV